MDHTTLFVSLFDRQFVHRKIYDDRNSRGRIINAEIINDIRFALNKKIMLMLHNIKKKFV